MYLPSYNVYSEFFLTCISEVFRALSGFLTTTVFKKVNSSLKVNHIFSSQSKFLPPFHFKQNCKFLTSSSLLLTILGVRDGDGAIMTGSDVIRCIGVLESGDRSPRDVLRWVPPEADRNKNHFYSSTKYWCSPFIFITFLHCYIPSSISHQDSNP